MSATARMPPRQGIKSSPKIGGETAEVGIASTATGARGRAVATRFAGVGPALSGECQGFAPTP